MISKFDYYFFMIQLLIFLQKPRSKDEIFFNFGRSKADLQHWLMRLRLQNYVKTIKDGKRLLYEANVKVYRIYFDDAIFKVFWKKARRVNGNHSFYLKRLGDLKIYRYRTDKKILITNERDYFAFKKEGWKEWKAYRLK